MKQAINEVKRMQLLAGIITESDYNPPRSIRRKLSRLNEAEEGATKVVDKLIDKVEDAGKDVENKKVQADLLNKAIEADFDLSKIDPEQIKEYEEPLEEEHGGVFAVGAEVLEQAEVVEKIAHILEVPLEKVKKAIYWVKKAAGLIGRLLEKFVFWAARKLGANIENGKKWGIGAGILLGVVLFVWGVTHLPAIMATVATAAGGLALLKLGFAIVKGWAGISALWKKLKSAGKENADKEFSVSDFLTQIEPAYRERMPEKEKISTNMVYALSDWYDALPKPARSGAQERMKVVSQRIAKGDIFKAKELLLKMMSYGDSEDRDIRKGREVLDKLVQTFDTDSK